jgi:nucleotide-binding universal stress UspA family protein
MTGKRTDEANVIVVGVDGSEPSRRALSWAAHQARLTGASLHAVIAWGYPTLYGWGPEYPYVDFAEIAGKTLEQAVADVVRPGEEIDVRQSVLVGHPAAALIDVSRDAQLLVVGSRGHGGVVGALLGSVSQYCAHHAHCPVVIVRADTEPEPDPAPEQSS